jgi:peptide/nickel transport system substrate-binding protein
MKPAHRILSGSTLILLIFPLCLTGCGPAAGPGGGAAERGGTAVIGVRQCVDTFNLYASTLAFTQEVTDLLFLRLVREQPDFQDHPPTFEPELAESWEFGDDGSTVTFHLRRGVTWSDGVPTTARDVEYSWQIARDGDVGWLNSDTKQHIESVDVLDDYTIRFRFSRRYPYQVMDINEGNIYPRHVLEPVPVTEWRSIDWSERLVFNGPFLLEEHRHNDSFTLVRNPDHFDPDVPGLDRVVFRIVPDTATLLTQLLAGDIDVMQNLQPRDIARVRNTESLEVFQYPDRYFQYLCWNTMNPLFGEPEVRRALSHGIDIDEILDAVMYGTGVRATSPIISVFYEHDDTLEAIPYRPDEARRLLARQGWTDTDGNGWLDRDGREFAFELETNAGRQDRQDAAEIVQSQLREIGIRAEPRIFEMSTFQQKHLDKEFDAFIFGWRVGTKPDYLETLFHSTSPYNYPSYTDPRLDQLIKEAPFISDPREALPLWQEAQKILHRDQPYTLMFERQVAHGVSRRLRGVRMDHLGPYAYLAEWWIPAEERRF